MVVVEKAPDRLAGVCSQASTDLANLPGMTDDGVVGVVQFPASDAKADRVESTRFSRAHYIGWRHVGQGQPPECQMSRQGLAPDER